MEALRKQGEVDELAAEPSRTHAPCASIEIRVGDARERHDARRLHGARLTEQARRENVRGFTRQAWVPSKGGEVWTRVHRCSFFNERGVECQMRVRQVVTGDARSKSDAESGSHALEKGDIPHADHNKSSREVICAHRADQPRARRARATRATLYACSMRSGCQMFCESDSTSFLISG